MSIFMYPHIITTIKTIITFNTSLLPLEKFFHVITELLLPCSAAVQFADPHGDQEEAEKVAV